MSEKHMGSGIDDFLKEEGIFEGAVAQAVNEVAAWERARATNDGKDGLEQEFGGVER